MKNWNKTALIVVAHDGLVSLCTGVGVVVRSFIEAFDDISKESEFLKNNNVDLFCLAPFLRKDSPDFRKEIKDMTQRVCSTHGGKLVNIPTFSDGSSQSSIWGGATQWLSASLSVAAFVYAFADKYEKVVIVAHDTIFSSIRKFIPSRTDLQIIWIPHSLGSVFHDEFSDKQRIILEKEAIAALQKSKNDVIGYIGNASKRVLRCDYNVKASRLVPFINGVYRKSSLFDVSTQEASAFLRKQSVSPNKKIMFVWGRCTYQKGYDVLIPAFGKFVNEHPEYHLVAIMPLETSMDSYVQDIKKKIEKLPKGSITPVFNFKKTLPASVLQLENLGIVVFPARFEGAPLTPLEALLFTKDGTRFVYSDIPPHRDIFRMNKGAVSFTRFTPEEVYRALTKAVAEKGVARSARVVSDFVKNTVQGIDAALINHV